MGLVGQILSLIVNRAPPPVAMPSFSTAVAPQGNYLGYARAYTSNEIVYSAIEMRATSASEPVIIGRRWQRESPRISNEWNRLLNAGIPRREIRERMIENGFFKELPNHPLVRLLNKPNPFMSASDLWGTMVMDHDIGGNAYLYKARANGGALDGSVQELWRLRPDRVKVIPGPAGIEGYEYNIGTERIRYRQQDIIHWKTRNPLNEFYGMSPLQSLLPRLAIDEFMRSFLRDFYEHGGSGPGAVLTSKARLPQEMRDAIREDYKRNFGGPQGAHELMVLDNTETTYQQLGLNRGLRDALPKEIDAQTEARIAMVYGVPGSLLGLLIGYETSSYANQRQAWQVFWDLTMAPLLNSLDDCLSISLVPDFGGIDEVLFDISDIRALQEDVDKLRDRYRKDLLAGAISRERWQVLTGEEQDDGETIYVPSAVVPTKLDQLGEAPEPTDVTIPPQQAEAMFEVKHSCGRLIARDVLGNPELWCPRCKVAFRPHVDPTMKKVVRLIREDGALVGAEEEMVPV